MATMTLEDAKRIARETAIVRRATAGLYAGQEADAIETLLSALGEPTPEDREAAEWMREQAATQDWHVARVASRAAKRARELRAARYRRAADALERSPAAIRRAAFEEAAKVVDRYVGLSDEAEHIAHAIRALDGGASPRELATPATPSPSTPLPD